jgi:phosphoribosylcarboxyaminoimidazole (NCAIR) mutase
MSEISVLVLMGSDSDAGVMQGAVDQLRELGIAAEMTVASAHRSQASWPRTRRCP